MWALVGAMLIGLSLGLLGSGGSILTVPALVFLAGEPDKLAIAESLGIVGAIAAVSVIHHWLQRHIDWRSVLLVGPASMVGSYAGAWASQWIPGRAQLALFAVVMLVAAYRMFRNTQGADLQPQLCRPVCLIGIGVGLGLLSGLVGVGGGFLIVPALVLLGGLPMSTAVGTSLVIICLSAVTGFMKHLHLLHAAGQTVHWSTLGMFALVGALGSLASRPLARRLPQHRLQRIYSIMVVVMALVILGQIGLASR